MTSEVQTKNPFRAIGLIKGQYQPNVNPTKGRLILEDGTKIKAVTIRYLRTKIYKKPDLIDRIINDYKYWRVYPKTTTKGKLRLINLIAYNDTYDKLDQKVNTFNISGIIVPLPPVPKSKENVNNQIAIQIRPQALPWRNRFQKPFNLIINGDVPKVLLNQFWSVKVRLENGFLYYVEGECLQDEYKPEELQPIEETNGKKSQQSSLKEQKESENIQISSDNNSQAQTKTNSNLDREGIIMIEGRIPELSIKFETRPDLRSTGKKVTLQVTGENGIAVRASINRKTLKKQVEKMDSFEQWVGVLSGKMQGIADDGVIELEGAGMNVFERKSKVSSK